VELRPEDEEALVVRGLIFEALGRRDEAVIDFRRALALNAGALPEIPRTRAAGRR
jgi:Flp pilus assembly protein TadD